MKISVVTTLYNYRNYVTEAIDSFLQQQYADAEMIIVDDASIDNPYEVIKPLLSDKVIYIRLDENQGYSHAKNIGIRAARAEVLVMLDADDMLAQNSLAIRFQRMFDGNKDFVHGPALDLSKGHLSPSRMTKKWQQTKSAKYVHAQGVMLKKDIHRKIGLYDEELRSKSDREMFYRVFNHGFKIGWVKQPVALYRRHGKQMHKSKEKLRINKRLQQLVKEKVQKRKTDLSGLLFLD